MNADQRLQRAIDHIEARLADPLCLTEVAAACFLSPFHFARLFRARTGLSVMHYVRLRRLTCAVVLLRQDPVRPTLIEIAVEVGFDSVQGFSNAFRKSFGISPGAYRRRVFPVHLQEPIDMNEPIKHRPEGPVFRDLESFGVAGLSIECMVTDKSGIPILWQRFGPLLGTIPGQQGDEAFGLCISDRGPDFERFTYMAAVKVDDRAQTDLETVSLPANHYAVFTHRGSLDHIEDTMAHIFGEWLPESGYEVAGIDFERYPPGFDPTASDTWFEYCLPVRKRAS